MRFILMRKEILMDIFMMLMEIKSQMMMMVVGI